MRRLTSPKQTAAGYDLQDSVAVHAVPMAFPYLLVGSLPHTPCE